MRIRLLGTAAGGGVPQWNCNCLICREARVSTGRVRPRTQSSVAISADDQHWFLLNASPDIRAQIEAFPPLQPPGQLIRGSPIQAVLLTNADLDHTLGLFLLREGTKLRVHATSAVRQSLTEGISLTSTLSAFCGIEWVCPPSKPSSLLNPDGSHSGLFYQALPLVGLPPRFEKLSRDGLPISDRAHKPAAAQRQLEGRSPSPDHVVGYRFVDSHTGGRLVFLPDVPAMDQTLKSWLADCDVLLFDGTFWAENEMQECGVAAGPASSMGHVPISGPVGSLAVLKELKISQKVYIHINNTNPVLLENSAERAAVLAAGCTVGHDGMDLSV